jgi:hypothetical protein
MNIKTMIVFTCLTTIPFSIFGQSAQRKTVYSFRTSDFDPQRSLTIDIEDNHPFSVIVDIPADSIIQKVDVYYNDQNARSITKDFHNTSFNIRDLRSIMIRLQIAKKEFAKARPVQMAEVSYQNESNANVSDTVMLSNLNEFITSNKIGNYSVKPVTIQPAENQLVFGDSKDFTILFLNRTDSLKNSNLLIGALIKTLAGARPQDELIDLFIKLNYGKQKRFFSLMGADAGIGSNRDTAEETGLFRINEAIVNFNYAFYSKKLYKTQKVEHTRPRFNSDRAKAFFLNDSLKTRNVKRLDSLKRTAFMGAGLKIFNSTPYIGIHFGSIEINGPLFGSYIMGGYYYSPYLEKTTKLTADSLQFRNFRNNIYLEAGINAFGSNVPSILKTLKLKFGLMLPIKGKDDDELEEPKTKDVISRLAIEVPLGTVFRF